MAGFSLMNGLSAAGSAVADYSTKVGLEAQKAELAQQSVVLADKLATARTLNVDQPFAQSQQAALIAGNTNIANITGQFGVQAHQISADASVKAAGISAGGMMGAANIAANANITMNAARLAQNQPLVNAQAAAALNQTTLSDIQVKRAMVASGFMDTITQEYAKDHPDQTVIAKARDAMYNVGMDLPTVTAISKVNAESMRTQTTLVTAEQGRLAQLTAAYNSIDMQEGAKPAAKALIDTITNQLADDLAQLRLQRGRQDSLMGMIQGKQPTTTPGGGATTPDPNAINKFYTAPGGTPSPSAPASGPRPGMMNSGGSAAIPMPQ